MRRLRPMAIVPLLALSLPLRRLAAQEAMPAFRRGQWGAVINIGNGFSGGGFLRFRDATHAWVVDLSPSISHSSSESTNGGFSSSTSSTQESAFFRLGSRAYRAVGSRVHRLLTAGLSGQYAHTHATLKIPNAP